MHVDEFIKMNASERSAKHSQLTPFRDAIIKLKNEGFTERKILEFLALNNVVVNQSTLHRYMRRQADSQEQKKKATETVRQRQAAPNGDVPNKSPKAVDSTKPSWVPDHINVDELLSKS
ncbi:hypothetical protein CAP48_19750 (plasmid) [Advenella sp. S44]|uniref:hypothetical protein n=1 Tax=Advenella sp. S44 TaxID=1982755 RepID=UPI000C296516|nr:hypothetical protein [Advenella sp. S44]PJX19945.1 hypothetical protein CAP48_19750 [Advenella sp. S44]